MQIDKAQVTRISDYRYVTEASDLGLAPGKYPEHVEFKGNMFFPDVPIRINGEVAGVRYECRETREALDMLND